MNKHFIPFLLFISTPAFCQSVDKWCGQPNKIKDYLIAHDYIPLMEFDSVVSRDRGKEASSNILDFTRLIININGKYTSVLSFAKEKIKEIEGKELSVKGYITDNRSFCEKIWLRGIMTDFDSEDLDRAMFVHIWESGKPTEKNIIFIRFKENYLNYRKKNGNSKIDSLTRRFKFESVEVPPKSKYSSKFPFLPMEKWKDGMRFLVNEYSCVSPSGASFREYQKDSSFSILEHVGDIFTFRRFEKREIERAGKKYSLSLLIFEKDGKEYEYVDNGILKNVENLVYIDDLETVKRDLLNKSIYLIVDYAQEYDKAGKMISDFSYECPGSPIEKFSKVRVEKIDNGIQNGPVRIWFTIEGEENIFAHYVSFSQINNGIACIRGNPFDRVFMIDNPKEFYDFSPEVWKKIRHREIQLGMSTDAIRLSQGVPSGRAKSIQGSNEYQIWDYVNHRVLFKDNIAIVIE